MVLEEIAGVFKLSTNQVIDRIKSLEELKILNGVIDERGKYIYVTEKEMEVIFSLSVCFSLKNNKVYSELYKNERSSDSF